MIALCVLALAAPVLHQQPSARDAAEIERIARNIQEDIDHSEKSRAADRAAIDQAIRGVYEVISGPPGQKRDFDRMRAMFAPGATMKAIGPRGLRGGSVEDYISRNSAILEKEGFTERELARRLEVWGGLATAWSAYDGRTASGSFHERGINTFQLVKVDSKWLVASILWQEETPDNPLPYDLLKGWTK